MKGQVALVTGGARSIGREIAETLAARGAHIVSVDLLASDETVAAISAEGGSSEGLHADVTDERAVESTVRDIVARHGRIDVLVNNAGLFATVERRPFWEIDVHEWDRMLEVNVKSVFLCCRAVSLPMREARAGRIVNLSSNTSVFGMPNFLHYLASKSAVVGMTRGLARELGPFGIGVNAVAPGLVTTELTSESVPEAYRRQVAEGQCITEPLTPPDIAGGVAYLCSPAARLVTGQTLLINGGANMGPA